MKRLAMAAVLLCTAFASLASTRAETKNYNYSCFEINTGKVMVLNSGPDLLGGANFWLKFDNGAQVAIERAAPVDIEGRPGFFHPEEGDNEALIVIVLNNGSKLVTKYGGRMYTCGLMDEFNVVDYK